MDYINREALCSDVSWHEHDVSRFRCGEQLTKRWFKKGNEPFICKGSGKSLMVSDFLVSHPSGPLFNLNEAEWS